MTVEPNEPALRNPGRKTLYFLIAAAVGYFLIAYVVLPLTWRTYAKRHPALEDIPEISYTANGIPGDPLNIALIGIEEDVHKAMLAGKWFPADPITFKTSMRISEGTLLHRSYDDAPVSNLILFGRKQDLAFEQPVGNDPRQRHHVRFWRAEKVDENGTPLWIGSATFDRKVGFSHTTGQITHHISANVDGERDKIIDDLTSARQLKDVSWIDGFHKKLEGKNGGGDPWSTDGRVAVGTIGTPVVNP